MRNRRPAVPGPRARRRGLGTCRRKGLVQHPAIASAGNDASRLCSSARSATRVCGAATRVYSPCPRQGRAGGRRARRRCRRRPASRTPCSGCDPRRPRAAIRCERCPRRPRNGRRPATARRRPAARGRGACCGGAGTRPCQNARTSSYFSLTRPTAGSTWPTWTLASRGWTAPPDGPARPGPASCPRARATKEAAPPAATRRGRRLRLLVKRSPMMNPGANATSRRGSPMVSTNTGGG